jgi:hypothetical protein
MKSFFLAAILCLSAFACDAAVVRRAPDFTWEGAGSASQRSFKGQPVVLLFARNARVGAFRAQVKKLREIYQEFSNRKVIFAAAIASGDADIRSDIPFVIATNGAQVAADYGVNEKFAIAIIGRDGNVDYQTNRVLPASRVREVIANSFAEQSAKRK